EVVREAAGLETKWTSIRGRLQQHQTSTQKAAQNLRFIHKVDVPLRPIVSCVNTFAYDLSAYLTNILSLLTRNSDFTVTIQLTSRQSSTLVRAKDAAKPAKQDGVVYRIPCRCGRIYIGENERPMQDRIRPKHPISPCPNLRRFRARPQHRTPTHTRKVKEAIYLRIHPNNINGDSGIEIPKAWIPTIKKHNNRRAV
ncbi:hypothetical protein pdam_00008336, partial [Pocillopora damicornis]